MTADPNDVRLYRRFANQRVTLDYVEDVIARNPGATFPVLIKKLYFEEPWTVERQRAAMSRARQAVHRLQHVGRVVRRRDSHGTSRFYLVDQAPSHTPSIEESIDHDPSRPDDLRAAGWRLLHHMDREDGMVSFVFTGEAGVVEAIGATDAEALNFIRDELAQRSDAAK